ncbi:hypothetical protein [Paenarthrobacter nitroguajacolicus]|uniref:hypothetical protein n=1 Tax=Paenarthrobacter nitroguajacolicus TaxID=211146 RepID=UPI004054669A
MYSGRGAIDLQNAKTDSLLGDRFDQARGKRVSNWRSLVGQSVQIRQGDHILDQGVVDAVTVDGRVLWLIQQGPVERRIVMKERGSGLWIRLMN